MPSSHLILCHLLLLLPLIFPSIRVFSKDSPLHIRWPKYWSFSFSTSPSNEYSGLISFRIDWFDFLAIQGTLKSLLQRQSRRILYCWDTREALLTLTALSSTLAYLYLQFCTPFRDSLMAQLVKNLPSIIPSIRVSSAHQVATVLELQLQPQSFQWIVMVDFL